LAIFLRDRVQRLDDAEAAISKATEVEPGYGYAWAMLAEFLAAKGRMEEAERAYRKATEVEPGDETGWGNLGWFLHHGRGDYAEADHAYRKALELEPSDPWTWRQLGQLLHEAVGRYSEAEEAYRKAIELDADDASTWGQLGRLLEEKLGRYAEAEEAYRKALALEPKQTGGWALLARLLHNHLGRPEEAEASFRRAVDLNPNDPQGWASFGQFLHGTPNRADEADAAYTRALELDPGMLPALLGRVQLLLRKPAASDEALRVAQDYLLKVEDDPNALRMASELFVRFGVRSHLPDVVKWTRKAVELRPDDALAHRVLAAASTGLGAEKDALSSAERYVNDAVVVEANVKDAIDLFVRLAAAGWGKQALDLLQRSPSAHLLEPLVVGLQLYLGEDVVAAAEILEVGRDVADRIRSRAGRAKDESVLTDQASVPVDGGEKKPAPVKRGRKRS
jgi:tetratricopeptide (TPR) repeat protein